MILENLCDCEAGFICVDKQCIKTCEGISCRNGTCFNGTCDCDSGFVNVANVCEETCALDPCEELIKICQE